LRTDFEELGLSLGPLTPAERRWLLTIDFEAFEPAEIEPWLAAMYAWADAAQARGLRFSVFLATEDVVRLRAADPAAYERFCAAAAAMARAGVEWHPHNHALFDRATGDRLPAHVAPGYGKRPSLFYDVVHVHGADLAEWLAVVRQEHAAFLADAGIAPPAQTAFRAGGWDYGCTADELRRYVEAVAGAGFDFDSSAVMGRRWQVAARFGSSTFRLAPGLAEVAPSAGADCGAALLSRRTLRALRDVLRAPGLWLAPRRPGVFVTVLHFDHLFVAGRDRPEELIRRHMRLLSGLGRALRLDSGGFGDLRLHASRR
jgi:hypothetical protein